MSGSLGFQASPGNVDEHRTKWAVACLALAAAGSAFVQFPLLKVPTPANPLFAYPNGQRPDFDGRTTRLLQSAGFRAACSTLWGTRNKPATLFALRRIMIDCDDDMLSFALKVQGAYDYLGILHAMKRRRHAGGG